MLGKLKTTAQMLALIGLLSGLNLHGFPPVLGDTGLWSFIHSCDIVCMVNVGVRQSRLVNIKTVKTRD